MTLASQFLGALIEHLKQNLVYLLRAISLERFSSTFLFCLLALLYIVLVFEQYVLRTLIHISFFLEKK